MKHKIKLLPFLLIVLFAFSNCSKDNDDDPKVTPPDKDKLDLEVTTKPASNLTFFSLISGGTVSGSEAIKEKGICWDKENKLPDINNSKALYNDASLDEFDLKIIELEPNTNYYVRAYATTSDETTVYGNVIEVKTNEFVPLSVSNSYVKLPDDALIIPVSRANETSLGEQISSGDKLTAELIWMDNEDVVDAVYTEGAGETGNIIVLTGNIPGNAVVTVKVNDKIMWSWHIWVTEDANSIETINMPSGAKLMDRNLGATSKVFGEIGAVGVQYEFGRKDPFTASAAFGEPSEVLLYDLAGNNPSIKLDAAPKDLAFVTANPLTYITSAWIDWANEDIRDWWTNEANTKTVYDPCPEGWKVASIEDYAELADEHFDKSIEGGHKFIFNNQSNYFPFTGYREVNGTMDATANYGTFWTNSAIEGEAGITAALSPTYGLGGTAAMNGAPRSRALSIRCVKE